MPYRYNRITLDFWITISAMFIIGNRSAYRPLTQKINIQPQPLGFGHISYKCLSFKECILWLMCALTIDDGCSAIMNSCCAYSSLTQSARCGVYMSRPSRLSSSHRAYSQFQRVPRNTDRSRSLTIHTMRVQSIKIPPTCENALNEYLLEEAPHILCALNGCNLSTDLSRVVSLFHRHSFARMMVAGKWCGGVQLLASFVF